MFKAKKKKIDTRPKVLCLGCGHAIKYEPKLCGTKNDITHCPECGNKYPTLKEVDEYDMDIECLF